MAISDLLGKHRVHSKVYSLRGLPFCPPGVNGSLPPSLLKDSHQQPLWGQIAQGHRRGKYPLQPSIPQQGALRHAKCSGPRWVLQVSHTFMAGPRMVHLLECKLT